MLDLLHTYTIIEEINKPYVTHHRHVSHQSEITEMKN